jgi:glycosyltransferase involved in cell wall biosynthesis
VGSWAARKGNRVLVEALDPLLSKPDGPTLTLLGTAVPAEEVLAAFGPDARVRVRVVPHYERSELLATLPGQQVLLLPSYAEGASLALIEGMAAGLAPVATAVGSAPDLLTDGENGLLIAPGDALALRAAVDRLTRDGALLARLREQAHHKAQSFSWGQVAADTLALYERATVQAHA